jgi:hypothetical protein
MFRKLGKVIVARVAAMVEMEPGANDAQKKNALPSASVSLYYVPHFTIVFLNVILPSKGMQNVIMLCGVMQNVIR